MDKRRAPRNRSLLHGKVVYNDGLASMDCVVRNQSPGGMRLAISQVVVLPDEFDLHIPKKHEIHRVRMMWRRADEVGVAFVHARTNTSAEANVAADPAARLDEIVAEMARLEEALVALRQEHDRMKAAVQQRASVEPTQTACRAHLSSTIVEAPDVFDEATGAWVAPSVPRHQRRAYR